MSLLNDALRAAEGRQNQAPVAGAYTGQPIPQPVRHNKSMAVLVLVLSLLLAGGAAAWWLWPDTRNTVAPVSPAVANTREVIRSPEQAPVAPAAAPEPEVVAMPASVAIRQKPPVVEAVAVTQAPEVAKVIKPPTPQIRKPEPAAAPAPAPAPRPAETRPSVAAQQPPAQEAVLAPANGTRETPVKQQRETPAAQDLRATRQLEKLLATGDTGAAERALTDVSANQPAPNSRELFAREMLVQGMPERALHWLPEAIARDYASLRMLRARALLDLGELHQAIATLTENIPPVAAQPEYRMTLATLLQQAGQAEEAASQWSELIAYDDSRATWWLGLAIALEAGGRRNSAVRAYAQAAVLPGLTPSLTDYARERLNALQAGS